MLQLEFNLDTRFNSYDIFCLYRTQINKVDKLIYSYSTLVPRFPRARALQLACNTQILEIMNFE
jgi:hypothetical protein